LLVVILITSLGYNNCAENKIEQASLSGGQCGAGLPDSLRSPKSIDQAVQLINSLDKPLTIDCFIKSLKTPLQMFAVDSTASLQPSVGMANPRIFLISGNLILSMVPKGSGQRLLEMSEKVSANTSVKGEVIFPITENLPLDAPYSRIADSNLGTSCRSCHTNEGLYPIITAGTAYISEFIPPLAQDRVPQSYLRSQATICNLNQEPYRCQMLRALMIDGQAQDAAFP